VPSITGRVEISLTVLPRRAEEWLRALSRGPCDEPQRGLQRVRTGLDHLEFVVTQKADLHEWAERLDELGIAHSSVKELTYTENSMLTFRDPDNIQLEFFWRAQRVD